MSGQFSDSPRRKNGVFVIFYINIEEKSNLTFYLDLHAFFVYFRRCDVTKHVFFSQSAAWKFRDLMNINEISDIIPEAHVFKPISGLEIFPPKFLHINELENQQRRRQDGGHSKVIHHARGE